MDQRLIDKCEALGWSVRCDDDGGADVAQYTPADCRSEYKTL